VPLLIEKEKMIMEFDMNIDEFDTPFEPCEDCPSLDPSDIENYDDLDDADEVYELQYIGEVIDEYGEDWAM
jgi:hypothetical protein